MESNKTISVRDLMITGSLASSVLGNCVCKRLFVGRVESLLSFDLECFSCFSLSLFVLFNGNR